MGSRITTSFHQPGCCYRGYLITPSIPRERDKLGRFLPGGHACGGTFVCPMCKRTVGWCFGCDDADPKLAELCDDCWTKVTQKSPKT